jgi:hypothetical protein
MKEDWVPIKLPPPEVEEKLGNWFASRRGDVGFCLLCGSPIKSEADFIPNTNTHSCAQGLAFEAKMRREQRSRCNGK